MTQRTTDDVIRSLVTGLQPVDRLSPAYWRALIWTGGTLLFLTAFSLYYGLRHDLLSQLANPAYLLETLAILAAGICAAIAAFDLSTPQVKVSRQAVLLGIISSVLWVGLLSYCCLNTDAVTVKHLATHLIGSACVSDLAMLVALPAGAIYLLIRRAAPTHLALTGYMAVLAASSLSALACRITEANDSAAHLLLWHFIPVIAIGLLGALIGKWLLRW